MNNNLLFQVPDSALQCLLDKSSVMFAIGQCQEIFGVVVVFDAVEMVDNPSFWEGFMMQLFPNDQMLCNVFTLICLGVRWHIQIDIVSTCYSAALPMLTILACPTLVHTRVASHSPLCMYELATVNTWFLITLVKAWLAYRLVVISVVFLFVMHITYYNIDICKLQIHNTNFLNIQQSEEITDR